MRCRYSILSVLLISCLSVLAPSFGGEIDKLDENLRERVQRGDRGTVPVIIRTTPSIDVFDRDALIVHRGRLKNQFWAIRGIAAEVDVSELDELSKSPSVEGISIDDIVRPFNDVTVKTVGANIAHANYDVAGQGVGIAVLDTGISPHREDLDGSGPHKSRIVAQWSTVGFAGNAQVSAASTDDYFGHGTHVAGIIAGNGKESDGVLAGIAPEAQIINVKVLGDDGSGYVSDVIEAIQWVIQNKSRYNIRVINLSLGHPVTESYKTDPLTQACEAAVRAGIVVVVAAGNYGKDEFGNVVYGGITSPGNDPLVITVGATKSQGTPFRSDDAAASYSSRGPTRFDLLAKPDLLAPGNRVKSIADPSPNKNDLYDLYPQNRVDPAYYGGHGKADYFTLSGTSMATPVVSGTIALMLEANPSLTPNMVKAILMTTSQDLQLPFVVQGAGYLNSYGAVMLAKNISRENVPLGSSQLVDNGFGLSTQNQIQGETVLWGGNIIWGNNVLWGGIVGNNYRLWSDQVAWGSGNVLWNSGNVLWNSGNVLWNSGNVLWNSGSALWGSTVLWGGNIIWGSNYLGLSAVQGADPVQAANSVWRTNVIWSSGNVLWNSGNVLWNSAVLLSGEN